MNNNVNLAPYLHKAKLTVPFVILWILFLIGHAVDFGIFEGARWWTIPYLASSIAILFASIVWTCKQFDINIS